MKRAKLAQPYHESVRDQLLPLLADEKDRAWLERATLPL